MSDEHDHANGITLGEIHRSVMRIESGVFELTKAHAETRETLVAHDGRIAHVEHHVNNQKNTDRLKAQVAQASLAAEVQRPSGDVISVKSLIALIVAVGGVVGAAVTAYFKATQ